MVSQAPVMKLDLTAAVDDLNVLNEDIAKKAGIDVSQYNQSLNSLKKATVKVNKKIENINKRFADAKTEKEKDALRKEGRELNLKLHEAFKYIQDHFIGIDYLLRLQHHLHNTKKILNYSMILFKH